MDSLHQMPKVFSDAFSAPNILSLGPEISDECRRLIALENFFFSLKRKDI